MDTDFTVQPRNEAYKHSAEIIQKITIRPKGGRIIAMACVVQPSGGHRSEGFCTELFNFVNYLIAHNSRF